MRKNLEKLVIIAGDLDKMGHAGLADKLDSILLKLAGSMRAPEELLARVMDALSRIAIYHKYGDFLKKTLDDLEKSSLGKVDSILPSIDLAASTATGRIIDVPVKSQALDSIIKNSHLLSGSDIDTLNNIPIKVRFEFSEKLVSNRVKEIEAIENKWDQRYAAWAEKQKNASEGDRDAFDKEYEDEYAKYNQAKQKTLALHVDRIVESAIVRLVDRKGYEETYMGDRYRDLAPKLWTGDCNKMIEALAKKKSDIVRFFENYKQSYLIIPSPSWLKEDSIYADIQGISVEIKDIAADGARGQASKSGLNTAIVLDKSLVLRDLDYDHDPEKFARVQDLIRYADAFRSKIKSSELLMQIANHELVHAAQFEHDDLNARRTHTSSLPAPYSPQVPKKMRYDSANIWGYKVDPKTHKPIYSGSWKDVLDRAKNNLNKAHKKAEDIRKKIEENPEDENRHSMLSKALNDLSKAEARYARTTDLVDELNEIAEDFTTGTVPRERAADFKNVRIWIRVKEILSELRMLGDMHVSTETHPISYYYSESDDYENTTWEWNTRRTSHGHRDIEYHTRLSDVITIFRRRLKTICPPEILNSAIKEYAGASTEEIDINRYIGKIQKICDEAISSLTGNTELDVKRLGALMRALSGFNAPEIKNIVKSLSIVVEQAQGAGQLEKQSLDALSISKIVYPGIREYHSNLSHITLAHNEQNDWLALLYNAGTEHGDRVSMEKWRRAVSEIYSDAVKYMNEKYGNS